MKEILNLFQLSSHMNHEIIVEMNRADGSRQKHKPLIAFYLKGELDLQKQAVAKHTHADTDTHTHTLAVSTNAYALNIHMHNLKQTRRHLLRAG